MASGFNSRGLIVTFHAPNDSVRYEECECLSQEINWTAATALRLCRTGVRTKPAAHLRQYLFQQTPNGDGFGKNGKLQVLAAGPMNRYLSKVE